MDRAVVERTIKELHAARVAGNLPALCALFADEGYFEIAGASADRPVAIRAGGLAAFRPWLAMMTKVFRLSDYALLSLVVEGNRAAAHWRVNILSRVTGISVSTELVDLVELQGDSIHSYREFFFPR